MIFEVGQIQVQSSGWRADAEARTLTASWVNLQQKEVRSWVAEAEESWTWMEHLLGSASMQLMGWSLVLAGEVPQLHLGFLPL